MSKACIDRSDSLIFQHKRRPCVTKYKKIFWVHIRFLWSSSLRGRRLKGKGKGVLGKGVLGARETWGATEVHFRSTESQTLYWSIMTADDSIKCWCANSGMTGQVGGFQNPGVCLQAFPSFLPHPSPLFYLRHFSRGLWLSFLVLCS